MCTCKATEANADGSDNASANGRQVLVAKVPQGYEANINIRLVPARDIRFTPEALGCKPRHGAVRRDTDPVALPESLPIKFKEANKKVAAWLAQEPANAKLFLERPVDALAKAGVDLTRAEIKALTRARRSADEAAVVAPGVKIVTLSASGYTSGRVGTVRPSSTTTKGLADDCDPQPRKKG